MYRESYKGTNSTWMWLFYICCACYFSGMLKRLVNTRSFEPYALVTCILRIIVSFTFKLTKVEPCHNQFDNDFFDGCISCQHDIWNKGVFPGAMFSTIYCTLKIAFACLLLSMYDVLNTQVNKARASKWLKCTNYRASEWCLWRGWSSRRPWIIRVFLHKQLELPNCSIWQFSWQFTDCHPSWLKLPVWKHPKRWQDGEGFP